MIAKLLCDRSSAILKTKLQHYTTEYWYYNINTLDQCDLCILSCTTNILKMRWDSPQRVALQFTDIRPKSVDETRCQIFPKSSLGIRRPSRGPQPSIIVIQLRNHQARFITLTASFIAINGLLLYYRIRDAINIYFDGDRDEYLSRDGEST